MAFQAERKADSPGIQAVTFDVTHRLIRNRIAFDGSPRMWLDAAFWGTPIVFAPPCWSPYR